MFLSFIPCLHRHGHNALLPGKVSISVPRYIFLSLRLKYRGATPIRTPGRVSVARREFVIRFFGCPNPESHRVSDLSAPLVGKCPDIGIQKSGCLKTEVSEFQIHSNLNGPQEQFAASMLPALEYECAGQSLHVDADVAAEAVLYFPVGHREHGAVPFSFLYFPRVHAMHSRLLVLV